MTSPILTAPVKLAMLKFDELSDEQNRSIHRATQLAVIAATCGCNVAKDWLEVLGPLAELHVMGMFTTLSRGKQLRGCCGFLGRPTALKDAILHTALRTVREDSRMAAISTAEIKYLSLDVSLLASPIRLTAAAGERLDHVIVGKHGLKITLGQPSGLLLPSVPVEQNWTAEEFLQGVCRKAGLPESAWTNEDAILETFEGHLIVGDIDPANLPSELPVRMPPGDIESLQRLKQVATSNLIAFARGATPSYYALDSMEGTVNGIVLTLTDTSNQKPLAHWIKTSLRPGMALQSSLFELCQAASQVLSKARFQRATDIELAITVLYDPIQLGTIQMEDWDGNQLHDALKNCSLDGISSANRAIVTSCGDFAAVAFDAEKSMESLLNEAACAVRLRRNPIGVYSMTCISTASSLLASNTSFPMNEDDVRPPAVAEGFYPSKVESRRELVAELKGNTPADIKPKPALALMTPHAGLRYSGQVAMNAWSSVELPSTLLILGPKHTTLGREWAVSPSRAWELPGGERWETDKELAQKIVAGVEGMELDFAAHVREHGVEIQLPILESLTPADARPKLVAIAIKNASIEEIMQVAEQLANVLRELPDRPLLVISSDMNHYEPEAENRRRDRLALDAMLTGDPKHLIETCRKNFISMCGLVPAAIVMQTLINLGETFKVEEICYDNSALRGNPDRVVGYAGVVFRAT